uniref:AAA+ ATPase domain-containing protein n=1 Tax=Emiliania huxleyi (strain CCMP1516) TaxID=280463 RepID=A0A0D3KER3_EMIH1
MDASPGVTWEEIAGLSYAKQSVREITVWPLLRPDIFTGQRRPPRGLLLFGPPGTGKTLIAKAIAAEGNATFFSISASSLMSKWMGDSERLVRALFGVARARKPSVIFIDEVDSVLGQRREGEHDSTIRVKNEILVQMDGVAGADANESLLFVGATNRPQQLDDAARRRLSKRLLIPLPDAAGRREMLTRGLADLVHAIGEADIGSLLEATDGYSGSDMAALCREAAMGPCRDPGFEAALLSGVHSSEMRPIRLSDFEDALGAIRASVGPGELAAFEEWNRNFGSFQSQAAKRQAMGGVSGGGGST